MRVARSCRTSGQSRAHALCDLTGATNGQLFGLRRIEQPLFGRTEEGQVPLDAGAQEGGTHAAASAKIASTNLSDTRASLAIASGSVELRMRAPVGPARMPAAMRMAPSWRVVTGRRFLGEALW